MIKRWGKNDKERLEKSIDICLNEVERLKKIVNDMLLLSKTEKEEVDLSKIDEINPKIIVEEVIEHYNILNPNVKYIPSMNNTFFLISSSLSLNTTFPCSTKFLISEPTSSFLNLPK